MKQLLQQLVNIHFCFIVFVWKNLRGKNRKKNRKKSCSRIYVPVFAVHTLLSPCICKTDSPSSYVYLSVSGLCGWWVVAGMVHFFIIALATQFRNVYW